MKVSTLFLSSLLLAALLLTTEATAQTPTLVSVAPARNGLAVSRNATVSASLSQAAPAAATTALKVFSQQLGGRKAGVGAVSGNSVLFAPTTRFEPGEMVMATLTSGAGIKHVWQFTAAAGVGPGTFTALASTTLPTAYELELGDLDGDGDLDLLANSEGLKVQFNDGSGNFTAGATLAPRCNRPALADVDNDGDLDALCTVGGSLGNDMVQVLLNNGVGIFGNAANFQVPSQALELIPGDVDADGDLDLAVAIDYHSPGVAILLNNGVGMFTAAPFVPLSKPAASLRLADVDNDGDLDILAPFYAGNTVRLRFNDGNGNFSGATEITVGPFPSSIVTGDFDGDGDVDFVTSDGHGTRSLSLATNTGAGKFAVASLSTVDYVLELRLADFDGDSDLDILTTEPSVMVNQGAGSFVRRPVVGARNNSYYGLATGDVDGDDDLDFVGAFGDVLVFKNQALPTATQVASETTLRAWPNPAQPDGVLHIALSSPAVGTAVLTTLVGQTVRQVALQGAATTDVALTGLPAGLYLLSVQTTGQAPVVRRVVVE